MNTNQEETVVIEWGAKCESAGNVDALHFQVSEYLILENVDKVITLRDDRGFTLSPIISTDQDEELDQKISLNEIETCVRNCVLPDEPAFEEHPYEDLAHLAQQQGFDITAEMLRTVPYQIVLSEEVLKKLR